MGERRRWIQKRRLFLRVKTSFSPRRRLALVTKFGELFFFSLSLEAMTNEQRQKLSSVREWADVVASLSELLPRVKQPVGWKKSGVHSHHRVNFFCLIWKTSLTLFFSLITHTTNKNRLLKSSQKKKPCATWETSTCLRSKSAECWIASAVNLTKSAWSCWNLCRTERANRFYRRCSPPRATRRTTWAWTRRSCTFRSATRMARGPWRDSTRELKVDRSRSERERARLLWRWRSKIKFVEEMTTTLSREKKREKEREREIEYATLLNCT